jgi:hypothetical protein
MSDMMTSYPGLEDLRNRQTDLRGIHYRFKPHWERNLDEVDNWDFHTDGEIVLTRVVEASNLLTPIFDAEDFVGSLLKFCIHTLNLFYRLRPLPSLEYFLALTDLNGKVLVVDPGFVGQPVRLPFICGTSGEVKRGFLLATSLAPGELPRVVASLKAELRGYSNSVLGAFTAPPVLGRSSWPPEITESRFEALFNGVLSACNFKKGIFPIVSGPG